MQSDYDRALALAKSGQLHEAQELLFGLEDERSERLLEKVNKAIAARGTSATVAQVSSKAVADGIQLEKQESFKFGCMVVLVLFAVMFLCVMAAAYQGSM